MKKIILKYTTVAMILICMAGIISCTKDFGSINTNPSIVTTPDVKFLFSYSENQTCHLQRNRMGLGKHGTTMAIYAAYHFRPL